jgi:hypothetical protein
MVATPVGMRCRTCAQQNVSLDRADARQVLFGLVAAPVAGVALGWIGLFLFVLGAVIFGYLVGEATLRAGGRRRGTVMQAIAGLGALLGGLLWHVPGFSAGHPHFFPGILAVFSQPLDLDGVGLGVFFAVMHVRNI